MGVAPKLSAAVPPPEVQTLLAIIEEAAGLYVDQWHVGRVLKRLDPLINAAGGIGPFISKVKSDKGLHRAMVETLCVHETRFFRHRSQFHRLEGILRDEWKTPKARKIWSVASSSGEEPYSIAMSVLRACPTPVAERCKIVATDISWAILKQAGEGRYPISHKTQVPQEYLAPFFLKGKGKAAGKMKVRNAVRRKVEFRNLNLIHPRWPVDGEFEVLFCRNVLIYLRPEARNKAVRRMVEYLKPGGYFFAGPSENIRGASSDLEMLEPAIFRKVKRR